VVRRRRPYKCDTRYFIATQNRKFQESFTNEDDDELIIIKKLLLADRKLGVDTPQVQLVRISMTAQEAETSRV